MKEPEIWQFAADRLKRGQSVMLLIVAESSGSSPGRQGFKMIVAEDDLAGSIGGGVMEVELVEQAKSQISNFKSQINSKIIEQVHQKNSPDSSGMICSGKQTVIFFRLDSTHLNTVNEIIHVLENGYYQFLRIKPDYFKVVDLFSKKTGERVISKDSDKSFDFIFEKKNENDFIYEELLGLKNKLFIIGGGHCALALSELMAKMDFHISLFDDRPNLNTLSKNKFAHTKTVISSYEQIDEFIPSGANVYVVVMTLGFAFDEIVIRKLFDKDFKYFGVLGSRAKMATLLKNLRQDGFDAEKLNKIRTPIGLPINSQTPEEIAVSIAAEIISVKNAK